MNRTNIKLCGFQTVADVQKAISLDIDAIGFILVPGRKRTVTLSELKEMVLFIPKSLHTVGVMMEPTLDQVTNVLLAVPLTSVQLHGEESAGFCRRIKERFPNIQLIKTFHMQHNTTPEMLTPYLPWIDIALLDSTYKGQKGGTGKTFDWSKIPLFTAWAEQNKLPLWVAGGIAPHNVQELVHTYHPDGVDVSSGIEQDGKKELAKMRQLIANVQKAEQAF